MNDAKTAMPMARVWGESEVLDGGGGCGSEREGRF